MTIKKHAFAFFTLCILEIARASGPAAAGEATVPHPQPSQTDLHAVSLAFELVGKYGETIWPGFSVENAPVLLIDKNVSYYLNQPNASDEFQKLDILFRDHPVFVKKRTFPSGLQASFPYLGRDTVVIGTPANTGQTLEAWILTFVHELFHVFQGRLGFQQHVSALNIGPDSDGSWQLSYPFPYEEQAVIDALHLLGYSLFQALEKEGNSRYEANLSIQAFQNLERVCKIKESGAKDFAYLDFQISKEGVARYVEYNMAKKLAEESAAAHLKNDAETDFQSVWSEKYQSMKFLIKHSGSVSRNRLEFYHLGLGVCLLLDRVDPNWKENFYTEQHFLTSKMTALQTVLSENSTCPN